MPLTRTALFLALAFSCSPIAHAAVTNIVWYRLGEMDAGATSGAVVNSTSQDLIGTKHLTRYGSPHYTNLVSIDASNHVGSTLAIQFDGATQYLSNGVVSTVVDNFCIEAWAKPNGTNAGSYYIASNGDPLSGGWGIYRVVSSVSQFRGYLGPSGPVGSGAAPTNTWAHVALVRDSGTTRLYVNGVAGGSTSTMTPGIPSRGFVIGAAPETSITGFFNGGIDEVRVFTFAPGQFSTNDLLINQQRISTLPATALTATNATLNGAVYPFGLPTTAWFEWGTTTNYGNVTAPGFFGGGVDKVTYGQDLLGALSIGVTYNFRAVASNAAGIFRGANQSFTTPIFYNINATLPGVFFGAGAWGDFDNDGRLDLLLGGATVSDGTYPTNQVWRNTGSSFETNALLPYIFNNGTAAWDDFNNDGRLDAAVTSVIAPNSPPSYFQWFWLNTGTNFTRDGLYSLVNYNMPFDERSAVGWGDYDNDGRDDFVFAGPGSIQEQLWRNTRSGFVQDTNSLLAAFHEASFAWGDFDNDGRLDLLIAGTTNNIFDDAAGCEVWRNTGNGFTNIQAGITPVYRAAVAWGDYDNDGLLDILIAGRTYLNLQVTEVWRNTGSGFTNIHAGLTPVSSGTVAWGDFDNDGRLDILLTGTNDILGQTVAEVWRNTPTGFTNINTGLTGVCFSSAMWGDYDNDGRLDIILTGLDTSGNPVTQIWRNATPATNTPPTAPSGLAVSLSTNGALFSWNSASDAQTPSAGLSYNVRAGSTPGGNDLVSGNVDAATGFRRLPAMGNANLRHNYLLAGVTNGQSVYWSVQAVDSSFAGGPFAAENASLFLTQLSITNLGGSVAISWSPAVPGWFLQETTNLSSPSNWIFSPSGPANPVTIPASAPIKFYRVIKP